MISVISSLGLPLGLGLMVIACIIGAVSWMRHSRNKADTFAYFLFGCGAGLVVVGGLVTFVLKAAGL